MLLDAANEFDIDLSCSVMIGDRASDVAAGFAAGCRTVFIDLGYEAESKPEHPTHIAESLCGAVEWVLAHPLRSDGV